jgi:hypothetical protein
MIVANLPLQIPPVIEMIYERQIDQSALIYIKFREP